MAANLIFIRHGTTSNMPDAPLSEIGLTEVHMASEKVAGWGITSVFSSPARRCVSTAKVLAKPAKAGVKTDVRLGEGSKWEAIEPFIDELRRLDGNILVVTHAPVIKSVLVQLLGIAPEKIDISRISPLSYSTIELDGSGHGNGKLDSGAKAGRLLADMFYESSKLNGN
jgi:broad specificity phosphatase PhoE